MLLRKRKLLWSLVKILLVLGVLTPSQQLVEFGSFISMIKRKSLIIFLFVYVILFLYTLICHYMHETWSWHAYSYALGFLWKYRCDTRPPKSVIYSCQCGFIRETCLDSSSLIDWLWITCQRFECTRSTVMLWTCYHTLILLCFECTRSTVMLWTC
jgi:hypothetical protein